MALTKQEVSDIIEILNRFKIPATGLKFVRTNEAERNAYQKCSDLGVSGEKFKKYHPTVLSKTNKYGIKRLVRPWFSSKSWYLVIES
jgi:hypothetical protein